MPTTAGPQSIAPRLDYLDMAGLLQLKVAGDPFPHSFIHEVDVYSAPPEDLVVGLDPAPGTEGKETAWYLCSPVNGHQSAGRRNRQVGGGGGHMFWHPEGGKRPIQGPYGKSVGAYRCTLSYVQKVKNPPGTASKTHRNIRKGWCMIEVGLVKQHAPTGHQWEICKVYRSPSPPSRADPAETSTAAAGADDVVLAAGTGMSGVEVRQHDSTPEAGAIPEVTGGGMSGVEVRQHDSTPEAGAIPEVTGDAGVEVRQHNSTPEAGAIPEVTGGGTPCPPAPLPSSCAFKQGTLAIVNKSNAAATVVVKIVGSSIVWTWQIMEMANLVLRSPAVAGIVLSANEFSTLANLRAAINAREASEIHKLVFANIRLLNHRTIDKLGLDRSIFSGYLDELEQHLQNIYLTKELSPSTRDYLVSFRQRMSTIVFYEYLSKLGKGKMQEWELRPVTTFGRDGSDLTAAIIGRELGSKEIQVWNDKCSIFTCDPDVYANAIPIPCLTFDEAAELGFFSGKSMQVVKEDGIKVIVKDLYNPQADGTVITKTRDMSKCTLTSIVLKSNITMLDIEATSICMLDQKAFVVKAISVFDIWKYWSIDIEWVANSQGKISLALVPPKFQYNHKLFEQVLDKAVQKLTKFAIVDPLNNKSVISLIGNPQMLASILEKACSVLQSNHIAVQKASQGLSKQVKVSLVVDDSEAKRCVELLHRAFFDTNDNFPAIVNSSGVARSCNNGGKEDDSLLLESSERAHLASQFYTGGKGVEPTSSSYKYLYWEKVRPINGVKYDSLMLLTPLMRNWTETTATSRDDYDIKNGRGHGKVDDIITEEYRREKIAEEYAEREKSSTSKRSTGSVRKKMDSSTDAPESLKVFMEQIMNEMKEIRKEMHNLPELCAQRVIEKINKTGMVYKSGTMTEGEENGLHDISESKSNHLGPRKEFPYDDTHTPKNTDEEMYEEYNVMSKEHTPNLGTTEVDLNEPIEVVEGAEISMSSSFATSDIAAAQTGPSRDNEEYVSQNVVVDENEVIIGKRKRKQGPKTTSPYVVLGNTQRKKRTVKQKLFSETQTQIDHSTDDLIAASVKYVRSYENAPKRKGHDIFDDGIGEGFGALKACLILDNKWLSGDVIDAYASYLSTVVWEDRYLVSTVRTFWLLNNRKTNKRPAKSANKNKTNSVTTGPVGRCMHEYFVKPKAYFPLNKGNQHWITVVMNSNKKEFQVLDSLVGSETDGVVTNLVEQLRTELAADIHEANEQQVIHYHDVSEWPIKPYRMPQQEDGSSCGLFVLQCFHYWNGEKFTCSFSQESVNQSRELMVAQIIFATTNKLDEVKDKVARLAKKKK